MGNSFKTQEEIDRYKKQYPNITNKALLDMIINSGLQFGDPIGIPKQNVGAGISGATIQPDQSTNPDGQKQKIEGGVNPVTGTLIDLLPAIFGVGAGLIGRKAGLKPNDALGLGVTTMKTGQAISDTYQNNRQRYYGNLASKIVDGYVEESKGQIDPNMIYKRLQNEHPDVFKNINPADLLSEKMAERNKVIDLSTREYTADWQKKNAYDQSKAIAFKSGGEILSPDVSVGPNISYRYANHDTMMKRLTGTIGNKYSIDGADGRIRFDNKEDYDKFIETMKSAKETGPDGKTYTYDMMQVMKYVKPPETDTKSAKNEADIKYKEALTNVAKAREEEIKRRSSVGSARGGVSKKSWGDMFDDVQRGWIGSADDIIELTNILYALDTKQITPSEAKNQYKEVTGKLTDSQDKPDWFMELMNGKKTKTEDKGSVY